MSRPDPGLCSCKIMDLRAVAKRLRETAQFVDGLLPLDPNPRDVPTSLQLDYLTRGRSFQEGFAARDRKNRKGGTT